MNRKKRVIFLAAVFELLKDDDKVRTYKVSNDGLEGTVTYRKHEGTPNIDTDFEYTGDFGWPCYEKRAALFVGNSIIYRKDDPPKEFVWGVG